MSCGLAPDMVVCRGCCACVIKRHRVRTCSSIGVVNYFQLFPTFQSNAHCRPLRPAIQQQQEDTAEIIHQIAESWGGGGGVGETGVPGELLPHQPNNLLWVGVSDINGRVQWVWSTFMGVFGGCGHGT